MLVHHLVAFAFIDGWFEGAEINHENGIKTDNMASNLKWMTHGDNLRHAYKTGLNPTRPVRIVETGEEFANATQCAKYIDGHQSVIWSCLHNKQKTHKGYTFEYVEEDI